jgi:hypothetical protein
MTIFNDKFYLLVCMGNFANSVYYDKYMHLFKYIFV